MKAVMKLGKKDVVIILLVIALVVVIFSGRSSDEGKIVGRWNKVEGGAGFSYLEFFSDGTYVSDRANYEGNYSIDGNRIRLEGILVESKVFTFEIKGSVLNFLYSDGDVMASFKRDN